MWKVTYRIGHISESWVSGIVNYGRAIHAITAAGIAKTLCGSERRYDRDLRVTMWERQPITCKKCLAKLDDLRQSSNVSDWQEE